MGDEVCKSNPDSVIATKEWQANVCLKSCNLGPMPFPLYGIPAFHSIFLKVVDAVCWPQEVLSFLTKNRLHVERFIISVFRLLYCKQTSANEPEMGTIRSVPFLLCLTVTCFPVRFTSFSSRERASPSRSPVLYNSLSSVGIMVYAALCDILPGRKRSQAEKIAATSSFEKM